MNLVPLSWILFSLISYGRKSNNKTLVILFKKAGLQNVRSSQEFSLTIVETFLNL